MVISKEKEKWFTKQESNFREGLIIIRKYREHSLTQMEINMSALFLMRKNMEKDRIFTAQEMHIKDFSNTTIKKDLGYSALEMEIHMKECGTKG